MTPGHVYILLNPAIPGLLKIGKTSRTPEERAEELSRGTGVAAPFHVAFSEDVPDCDAAEVMIHDQLDRFRENKQREFFRLPLREAITILQRIAKTLHEEERERQAQAGIGNQPVDNSPIVGLIMLLIIIGLCVFFSCGLLYYKLFIQR